MKNTVLQLCVVVFTFLTFSWMGTSCSHEITANTSIINATRVCKPGPNVTETTSRKKCLVIGDSVSIGYTYTVKSSLKEICDVYHAPWDTGDGGALDTKYAVQCLQLFLRTNFLEQVFYDVIVFNFGLHDSDYNFQWPEEYTEPETYRDNLKIIKDALVDTGARVGYVLTTPVPFNTTTNERVKTLNVIARDVMSSSPKVPIADLYKWVTLICGEPPYSHCEIADKQPSPHYTKDGYSYLAVMVGSLLSNLLLPGQHNKEKHNDVGNDIKDVLSDFRLLCINNQGDIVNICPGNMTCSPNANSDTRWGCCPLPNAVSCTDGKHCCPEGFSCDPTCHRERCVCHQKIV